MSKPKVILFAGPIGSSKTPIAYHLSYNLGLPIFNRDAIRVEVREDLGALDREQFERRARERLEEIIDKETSFILDASIDRKWSDYKPKISNYESFIISLDISKELLIELYNRKGYKASLKRIDRNYKQHQDFLSIYFEEVGLSITDKEFNNRLEYALEKAKEWYTGYSSDG